MKKILLVASIALVFASTAFADQFTTFSGGSTSQAEALGTHTGVGTFNTLNINAINYDYNSMAQGALSGMAQTAGNGLFHSSANSNVNGDVMLQNSWNYTNANATVWQNAAVNPGFFGQGVAEVQGQTNVNVQMNAGYYDYYGYDYGSASGQASDYAVSTQPNSWWTGDITAQGVSSSNAWLNQNSYFPW